MPKEVKNTTEVTDDDVVQVNTDKVLVPGDEGWGLHDVLPPDRVDLSVDKNLKQRQQVDYPEDPGNDRRGPAYRTVEQGKVASAVSEADQFEVEEEEQGEVPDTPAEAEAEAQSDTPPSKRK
jgi:hypothetical protein